MNEIEELALSKVYIKTDLDGRILRCDGGYTVSNINDFSEWTLIDDGDGDRYNLCQTHYFDGGLRTWDGICRYAYDSGVVRMRTEEEIQTDRDAMPESDADYLEAQEALNILFGETP